MGFNYNKIWQHIIDLATALFFTLALITAIILIARIFRRNSAKKNTISYRVRLEVFLAYTRIGDIIELTQVIVSILSVALYITGTYQ